LLKALYPRLAVHPLGFQDTPLREEAFDVAISNVPFGDFPVVDRAYLKPGQRYLTRAIHNYFFVKALRTLRQGGVLAFVTSRYALDAPTAEPIRRYLYEHADLVAAVRLPSGTFPDTDVVTDQVILRKRLSGETPGHDTWLTVVPRTYVYRRPANARPEPQADQVGVDVNAFFVANPDMVLGVQGVASQRYGGGGYTVWLPEGGPEAVGAALRVRMRALPPDIVAPAPSSVVPAPSIADTTLDCKEGAYVDRNGSLRLYRGGHLEDAHLSAAQTVRVRALLVVRDAARVALRAQLDGAGQPTIERSQARLNAVYDQCVSRFGPLNAQANMAAMGADPDAFFLRALERWDTDTRQRHKAGRPVSEAAARERLKMPIFFMRSSCAGRGQPRPPDRSGTPA
jgi:hypothetical protein